VKSFATRLRLRLRRGRHKDFAAEHAKTAEVKRHKGTRLRQGLRRGKQKAQKDKRAPGYAALRRGRPGFVCEGLPVFAAIRRGKRRGKQGKSAPFDAAYVLLRAGPSTLLRAGKGRRQSARGGQVHHRD